MPDSRPCSVRVERAVYVLACEEADAHQTTIQHQIDRFATAGITMYGLRGALLRIQSNLDQQRLEAIGQMTLFPDPHALCPSHAPSMSCSPDRSGSSSTPTMPRS